MSDNGPSTWKHEIPWGSGETIEDANVDEWVVCPYCESEEAYLQNTSPYNEQRPTFECPDCETTEYAG